jgi:hypothetical protein
MVLDRVLKVAAFASALSFGREAHGGTDAVRGFHETPLFQERRLRG